MMFEAISCLASKSVKDLCLFKSRPSQKMVFKEGSDFKNTGICSDHDGYLLVKTASTIHKT